MSPCCGSVCLLVLLGVVVASGSPVQYVSENLKQNYTAIENVLGLKQPEIGSNPLFGSVIRSINTCQKKEEVELMNTTLDVYMRIFSSILEHNHNQHHHERLALLDQLSDTQRAEVVASLLYLQQKMKELKGRLNHLGHNKEDAISKLKEIKVHDPVVQRKALAEFKEIYQAASVIGFRSCGPAHSS